MYLIKNEEACWELIDWAKLHRKLPIIIIGIPKLSNCERVLAEKNLRAFYQEPENVKKNEAFWREKFWFKKYKSFRQEKYWVFWREKSLRFEMEYLIISQK